MSSHRDRRELPAYPLHDAAHYLRLPPSTLREWTCGRGGEHGKTSRALVHLPQGTGGRRVLSFYNLVECHVLSAIRRDHGVTLQRVRKALDVVRRQKKIARPLLDVDFETNGVDLFVRELERLVNVSSGSWQYVMGALINDSLKRIERDTKGLPIKLYPYLGPPRADAPRVVEVNPAVAFGRPVLVGTGIPTAEVASRARAGEPPTEIAEDFGISVSDVARALACETRVEGRAEAA